MNRQPRRDTTRLVVLVVLFVSGTLFVSTGGVAAPSTVEPGATISSAGTYELASNASDTTASKGLTVTGSAVELDGRGYRLTGPATRGSVGIDVPASADTSSLVVRNLTLAGWQTGIRASDVSTVTIRDTVVRSNHTGVRIDDATTVRIENATLVVADGTVFEDVDRLVLENTSIRTTDSESVLAVNTSVYVGRNVRLSNGVRVSRGVVRLDDDTPTAVTDTASDPQQTATSAKRPATGASSADSPAGSPAGSSAGSSPGGSGASSSGAGGVPPRVGTTTRAEATVTPANGNGTAPQSTTPVAADSPPSSASATTERRGAGEPNRESTPDSPTAEETESLVVSERTTGAGESSSVPTPGFGFVLAVSALGAWAIRLTRVD